MEKTGTRTERRGKAIWVRVALYSFLLALLGAAYAVTNYGLIPGYDPYFMPRETVDVQIVEEGGRRYLWGGDDPRERFDITEFRLKPEHLEYGLGRERIAAINDPWFMPVSMAEGGFSDEARVMIVRIGEEVRIYPISIFRNREVVNDTVAGKPIAVAYCLLANLGAVYERQIGDTTYTFAASGYTYYDWKVWNGYSAFVLWDRETESLWWPPIGKAVSGKSVDIPMKVLDDDLWAQTTWAVAKSKFPDADVLISNPKEERPTEWLRTEAPDVPRVTGRVPKAAIAPRWGANSEI